MCGFRGLGFGVRRVLACFTGSFGLGLRVSGFCFWGFGFKGLGFWCLQGVGVQGLRFRFQGRGCKLPSPVPSGPL